MEKITMGLFAILGLAIVYLFLFHAPTASSESTMSRISSEGKIKACYIIDPPFVIRDPNTGDLSGEAIDAMNYIAGEAGLAVEYSESSWSAHAASLQSKQCDVIVTDLFTKLPRAKSVAFTTPFVFKGESALVKKGESRFNNVQDFNKTGVRVTVMQGESGEYFAQKNLQAVTLTVLPGSDITLALAQVSSGKADAAFTDSWLTEEYARQHPETEDFVSIHPDTVKQFPIDPASWAVRQGDYDLLVFLNTGLELASSNAKFSEWEQKYASKFLRVPFTLTKGA